MQHSHRFDDRWSTNRHQEETCELETFQRLCQVEGGKEEDIGSVGFVVE